VLVPSLLASRLTLEFSTTDKIDRDLYAGITFTSASQVPLMNPILRWVNYPKS